MCVEALFELISAGVEVVVVKVEKVFVVLIFGYFVGRIVFVVDIYLVVVCEVVILGFDVFNVWCVKVAAF